MELTVAPSSVKSRSRQKKGPLRAALPVLLLVLISFHSVEAKRIGLIFGNNYTGNSSKIPSLLFPEKDARLIEQTLLKHGRFDSVKVLLGRMITEQSMKKAIGEVAGIAGKDDTVFIYYAGHATSQEDEKAPNGLRNFLVMFNRPHVPDFVLNKWLKQIHSSHTVVVFDACYTGGIARKGGRGIGTIPVESDSGRVIQNGSDAVYFEGKTVIGSADYDEIAYELPGKGIDHGIFTYWFARGMDPRNGDLNIDRVVTVLEAFHWAAKRTTDMARKEAGARQHPQISGNGSGILLAGNVTPVPPKKVETATTTTTVTTTTEPKKHQEIQESEASRPTTVITVSVQQQQTVVPEVTTTKPPETPTRLEDPVTEEEPPVVPTIQRGKLLLITTILESRVAGKATMDPTELLRRDRMKANERRNLKVSVSGETYPISVQWVDQNGLARLSGETIPLGNYTYRTKRYKNRVAVISIDNVPTGVHEVTIEADDYPVLRESVGVEKNKENRLLVVASVDGYATIRGKVFRENFDTPVKGHSVWMPTVTGVNQIHKMKTTSDGSFWFLNLPANHEYTLKASFEENLELDNSSFYLKPGEVLKLDVILGKKFK